MSSDTNRTTSEVVWDLWYLAQAADDATNEGRAVDWDSFIDRADYLVNEAYVTGAFSWEPQFASCVEWLRAEHAEPGDRGFPFGLFDVIRDKWLAQRYSGFAIETAPGNMFDYRRDTFVMGLRYLAGQIAVERLARLDIESTTSEPGDGEAFEHSSDYRFVEWRGKRFMFSRLQSQCLRILHEAWKAGDPGAGGREVMKKAGSNSDTGRLRDAFRARSGQHPAWGTLIVSTQDPNTQDPLEGYYRLDLNRETSTELAVPPIYPTEIT